MLRIVGISIEENLLELLDARAKKEKRPRSNMIQVMIDDYLNKDKKEKK